MHMEEGLLRNLEGMCSKCKGYYTHNASIVSTRKATKMTSRSSVYSMVTGKSTTNVSNLSPNCCMCFREFGKDVEKL